MVTRADIESLVCPVCLCIADSPTVTPCGHLFCASCLASALLVSRRCPLCRHPTSPEDTFGHAATHRAAPYAARVHRLVVKCLHSDLPQSPCQWRGTLDRARSHLSRCSIQFCPYRPYGCRMRGTQEQIRQHEQTEASAHFKHMKDALRQRDEQSQRLSDVVVVLHEVTCRTAACAPGRDCELTEPSQNVARLQGQIHSVATQQVQIVDALDAHTRFARSVIKALRLALYVTLAVEVTSSVMTWLRKPPSNSNPPEVHVVSSPPATRRGRWLPWYR